MKRIYVPVVFTLLVALNASIPIFAQPQIESAHPPPPPALSNIQLLAAVENVFVDIVGRSKPAVVSIIAKNVKRKPEQQSNPLYGTGFIFRKDGHILTNNHGVNGAKRIIVTLFDNRKFTAKLVGTDASTDIAVLKIDTDEDLPILPFADSDGVRVGQFAIAIGNPFRLDYTVTIGIVSGKGRSLLGDSNNLIRYQNLIQTDAWINRGNSGGPLLNIYGAVIGINSMILRPDGAPATDAVKAEAGFAIPINQAKKISDQLIANGKVIRGWLGIRMDENPKGIRVKNVFQFSPAMQGGIKRGDIISQYNGQKVEDRREFKFLIADSLVGEKVKITVLRRGKPKTLEVTIGEMSPERMGIRVEPQSESWTKLGLEVRELGKRDFERYTYLSSDDQGLIVGKVKIDALAPKAGIPRGALISAVNGHQIRNLAEFEEALKEALKGSEITFEIKTAYSEATEIVTVKLDGK